MLFFFVFIINLGSLLYCYVLFINMIYYIILWTWYVNLEYYPDLQKNILAIFWKLCSVIKLIPIESLQTDPFSFRRTARGPRGRIPPTGSSRTIHGRVGRRRRKCGRLCSICDQRMSDTTSKARHSRRDREPFRRHRRRPSQMVQPTGGTREIRW